MVARWKVQLEALQIIAQCSGEFKYGHSEVGNFTSDDLYLLVAGMILAAKEGLQSYDALSSADETHALVNKYLL